MSNNLPSNWYWIKLGDVCNKITDGTHFTPKYTTAGIPFISVKDVYSDKIHFDNCKYISKSEHHKLSKRCHPEFGDVLITKSGTIGRVAIVPDKKDFSLFVSVALLKPKRDLIKSNFLILALKNYIYSIDISQTIKGGILKDYHIEDLKATTIPLPPLPEQKKIVEKIEELFSELDSGVASLKSAKEQIRIYRQAVLASAFSGKLIKDEHLNGIQEFNKAAEPKIDYGNNVLPAGWKWVKLRDAAQIINGYAFKSKNLIEQGKYQVIKIGNVRPGKLRLEAKPAFVNEVDEEVLKRSLLKKDDLVISLTGTRKKRDYGYVAMVANQKNLLLNQRLATIRLEKQYDPRFFLYLLRTDIFLDQFFKSETGNVGQGNVGIGGIRDSIVPTPPLKEQTKIVEEIEKRFSEADHLEKAIDESLAKSEALQQSILKKAFEGRLV